MRMIEYMLGKIAEEGNEVSQRCIKAQRFGMGEVQPGRANLLRMNNRDRIQEEILDLVYAAWRVGFVTDLTLSEIKEREDKYNLYLNLSRKLGIIEKETIHAERTATVGDGTGTTASGDVDHGRSGL